MRFTAATSASTVSLALQSMFTRAVGNAPSSSSSDGIGALPSTIAVRTSLHGSSLILPGRPHVRIRSSSWKATTTPSAVVRTSVSR